MNKPYKPRKKSIYAPPERVVKDHTHNSVEGYKQSLKGSSRYFKVDGKPVAYIIGECGYRTKEQISPAAVRLVMNFFAKESVSYMGKVPQEEVEKYSD